jgi:uncharacterized protein YlxW (UPF0749 family)
MATDRTPTQKRIKRAEEGRDDWKVKATFRREENEKLKKDLEKKEKSLSELIQTKNELEDKLASSTKKILEQNKLIENLKKNL